MNRLPPTRRLSVGTLFYKKVVPVAWAAFVVALVGLTLWRLATAAPDFSPLELVPLMLVGVIAFAWTRLVAAGLVDEVLDGGDHLVVRQGGREQRVALAEIEVVKESRLIKQPPQIELVLTHPGSFGRVIAFVPTGYSITPLIKSPLFYELQQRIAVARRRR